MFLIVKKRTNGEAGTFIHMKKAFIYTDAYFDYDYGLTHPLKIVRLKLAYELIKACGLLSLPSVSVYSDSKGDRRRPGAFPWPGLSSGPEAGQ